MDSSINMPLFITLLGIVIVIPSCLLYIGKDNILMKIQTVLISEIYSLHSSLVKKAERHTHEKNVKGKKLKIKRALGKCPSKYEVSGAIFAISGLTLLSLFFCLFLAFASYLYTVTNNFSWINAVLVVAQFTILDMCIALCIALLVPVTVPVIYHGLLLLYWFVTTLIGFWIGFYGHFLLEISSDKIPALYHSLLAIPFIPVVGAIISTGYLAYTELLRYKNLRNTVRDFEKSKKSSKSQ